METIRSNGHEVLHIEDDENLKANLKSFLPDLAFLLSFRADPEGSILKIQALLETLGIPYTGSSPVACRTAQNKLLAKEKFLQAGILTSGYAQVKKGEIPNKKPDGLDYPLFIKPLFGGCSMGIHPDNPVWDEAQYSRVLMETLACTEQDVLVEEFISGREFTAGILGNDPMVVLPLIEFTALAQETDLTLFRIFDAKTDTETHEPIQCPADLGPKKKQQVEELAKAAFKALNGSDYAWVDIRCDQKGNPYGLEVNVHPSLLPSSSLPTIAEKAGIGYAELLEHIFQFALNRFRNNA